METLSALEAEFTQKASEHEGNEPVVAGKKSIFVADELPATPDKDNKNPVIPGTKVLFEDPTYRESSPDNTSQGGPGTKTGENLPGTRVLYVETGNFGQNLSRTVDMGTSGSAWMLQATAGRARTGHRFPKPAVGKGGLKRDAVNVTAK
jgi:hypothetical protein